MNNGIDNSAKNEVGSRIHIKKKKRRGAGSGRVSGVRWGGTQEWLLEVGTELWIALAKVSGRKVTYAPPAYHDV